MIVSGRVRVNACSFVLVGGFYSTESSSGPRVLDLYKERRSSTRGPEDDSVESKHVAPL